MSTVSVVMPVYNAEEYLKEAIESVLKQTFSDWKLILVDDGSTDTSGRICDEYSSADQRINVIHQENQGPSAAVKTGIHAVSTEWIMFLDADDLYEEKMIETMIQTAEKSKADCVRCGYEKFYRDGRTDRPLPAERDEMDKESILRKVIHPFYEKDGNIYRCWSAPRWDKIYRTALLKKAFAMIQPETTIGEDLEMNLLFLEYASKIVNIDSYLYRYRVLDRSQAHGYTPVMYQNYEQLWKSVRLCAEHYGHPYHAEPHFKDNGIVSMLSELENSYIMTSKERNAVRKELISQLSEKKAVLKVLLQKDFPMKMVLQKLKRRIEGEI